MNTQELTDKIENIVSLLNAYNAEAKSLVTQVEIHQKKEQQLTQREERINNIEIGQAQKQRDLEAQKEYIDEQTIKNKSLVDKILAEKTDLEIKASDKEHFEKAQATLKVQEKDLETRLVALEQDKALFKRQEEATTELQQLLEAREKKIKAKEEGLNRREQLTQV